MNGNRRLFSFAFTLMLIGILPLEAQVQEAKTGGEGKLEVVSQYDWGTVVPGKLEADIELKNVGEGPLKIDRVQPSCGCTLLSPLEDNLLAPGESTTVHLSLDARRRSGSLNKKLTIYSDDPQTPTRVVELVANIQTDVSFNPDTEK